MAADLSSLERRRRRERARRRARQQRQYAGLTLATVAVIVLVIGAFGGFSSAPPPHPVVVTAAPTATPGPPADVTEVRRALSHSSYLAEGRRSRKEVALTFDDGPGPQTASIAGWLRRHDVPATFFLVGRAVEADPAAVKRLHEQHFALGDHTQNHADLSRLDPIGQAAEIDQGNDAIHAATGGRSLLLRPPYGGLDEQSMALLRQRRMLMVLWSVDSDDFARPGPAQITRNVLSAAHAGSVVLMHDGGGDRTQTRQALPAIVRGLRKKGYRLVTVPQLLHDDPPPRDQPAPRSLSGRP